MWLCYAFNANAQNLATVKGTVVQFTSQQPLQGVLISLNGIDVITEANGSFAINNVPLKPTVLKVYLKGFQAQNIPVSITKSKVYDVGFIFLEENRIFNENTDVVSLNFEDFEDEANSNSEYIPGLFQSAKDTYLKAAAYNFSQVWFKVRGYDASLGSILINGIEMNKMYDGRPQWSNWGGLNDVFKNEDFSGGISANSTSFGNISGTTNFNTQASLYPKGGKVSFASTNKSYKGRIMASYASGLTKNNWAYVVSVSNRFGNEGYAKATSYKSWSGFVAVEKLLNKYHNINVTAFTSFNQRGKSSPNTNEVFSLKDYQYNAYWGKQNGKIRNSRMKEIFEPVLMLTHTYHKNDFQLTTSAGYQFGYVGNSRLGYFNAPNPDPSYWNYLPSSYLRYDDDLNYESAYLAEQYFIENGQINWEQLYQTNIDNGNSLYYLYEDRVNDKQLFTSSVLTKHLQPNLLLNAGISFRKLTSENYAKMLDLLGGEVFLDVDPYYEGTAAQNNVNSPNNSIFKGDSFQYHYKINALEYATFAQLQGFYNKVDFFASAQFKNNNFQRNGLYKNGRFPNNSFGKSEKLQFTNVSFKSGITYKFSARHLATIQATYISKAPVVKNIFSNARANNLVSPNLSNEKILSADVSYVLRLPKLKTKFTAFYTNFSNAVETSFFFAEGLRGNQVDFVNQTLTNISKKHVGAEAGIEYQATSTIKLLGAGSFGNYTYADNPHLYLHSDTLIDEASDFGTAYLKNYHISGTPQRAFSLGFEYQDPDFWWFQVNANHLSHNYISISPLLRTDNFYLDSDGVPFIDEETGEQVSQQQVNELLRQEKFNSIFLMNVVGGKSWKINDNYVGFFAGINNVLGETFKTGGFEQSRKSNYKELKEDKHLEKPIFGSKYWYSGNASYYVNIYVRF